MKTPIVVVIPQSHGDESWLRPCDARKLILALKRSLTKHESRKAEAARAAFLARTVAAGGGE